MKEAPVILVDMDGVLADFDRHFITVWKNRYPDRPALDQSRRTHFRIVEEFEQQYRPDIYALFEEPGFYLDLPVMPGAIAAMRGMKNAEYDVWICSTPQKNYRHCVREKYQWVDREFGPEWVDRIILTRRKAMVHGDVLIDDQPILPYSETASWKHVLFDAPYNQNYSNLLRINWDTWEPVLREILNLFP